jgi:V/A-type H+/Na+-transporting ATPase subunit I
LTVALTLRLLNGVPAGSGWLALASALGIVVLGFRRVPGILGRVGLGLYSLYGISGFLGDTLSYTRLVALGLTTGIVAMIINLMAGIALNLPLVGWLVALGVLLGGHAFNIAINVLGAFVHSCRLQYVEFFTKFYEAGGRPFKPFALSYRHTVVNR